MWESALQLGVYAAYVIFMKFNAQSERFVKKLLNKNKVTRVRSTDHLVPSVSDNRFSFYTLSHFHHFCTIEKKQVTFSNLNLSYVEAQPHFKSVVGSQLVF